MTRWNVIVSGGAGAYVYGPFATQAAAQAWADSMKNEFYGQLVHVVSDRIIDPYEYDRA